MSRAAGTLPGPVIPWSGRLSQSYLGAWLLVFLFLAACFFLRERFPWIAAFPESLLLPIGDAINWAMDGLVAVAKPFFRGITWLLDHPMTWVSLVPSVDALARVHVAGRCDRLPGGRVEAGRIHDCQPRVHACDRLLGRKHEYPGAGRHLRSDGGRDRLRIRCSRIRLPTPPNRSSCRPLMFCRPYPHSPICCQFWCFSASDLWSD